MNYRNTLKALALLPLAVFFAGCASDNSPGPMATGSIVSGPKPAQVSAVASERPANAPLAKCGERHIEYQNGQRPGGTTVLAQKEAEDGICTELRRINGSR